MSAHIRVHVLIISVLAYVSELLATVRDLIHDALKLAYFAGLSKLVGSLAPRPGDATLSPSWLTHQLQVKGWITPHVCVKSVEICSLDGNRGLTGTTGKLVVTYSGAQGSGPATIIIKRSKPGVEGRRQVIVSGQYREALFYNSKAFQPSNKAISRVLYSHGSGLLGEFVILLEDMQGSDKADVTAVNLVFGNQVWGGRATGYDAVKVLRAMYLWSAEFHAAHWMDKTLLNTSWLKGASWYSGCGQGAWENAILRAKNSWSSAQTSPANASVQFSPKLIRIIDRSLAAASWHNLQAHLRNPNIPFTLCHGDFHASNMFLRSPRPSSRDSSSADLVLFDWSEVGPWEPTADLVQTLVSDVKAEIFVQHSQELVRLYWDRLTQLGVDPNSYPFEACWEGFCRGAERWIWIFCMLANFGLPAKAVQYWHDQLLSFIEAHGDYPEYVLKPVVLVP